MNHRSLFYKLSTVCILFLFVSASNSCKLSETDPTLSVYTNSLILAKNQNQKLLVIFGADWCPDCRAFDVLLREKKISELILKKFLILKIDVGQFDQNLALNSRLGNPIANGIPSVVIIDPLNPEKIVASTKGGEFSTASQMTAEQVYKYFVQY
ncbi:MAG: thioredoxin family protein [Leptospira sp.]|nr:thioredoxin family protein [Leptospira sp.]